MDGVNVHMRYSRFLGIFSFLLQISVLVFPRYIFPYNSEQIVSSVSCTL
jgi:hypothetical protein